MRYFTFFVIIVYHIAKQMRQEAVVTQPFLWNIADPLKETFYKRNVLHVSGFNYAIVMISVRIDSAVKVFVNLLQSPCGDLIKEIGFIVNDLSQ